MAQWYSAWLETEGPPVRASPASLRCGPWARHIYLSLVLVQPRKTHSCLTERLLMGCKESNQTKNQKKKSKVAMHYTAILEFFNQHLLPKHIFPWTETWWKSFGNIEIQNRLKSSHLHIKDSLALNSHLGILQPTSSFKPYILLSTIWMEGLRQYGDSEIAKIIRFTHQRWPCTKKPSWNFSTNIFF